MVSIEFELRNDEWYLAWVQKSYAKKKNQSSLTTIGPFKTFSWVQQWTHETPQRSTRPRNTIYNKKKHPTILMMVSVYKSKTRRHTTWGDIHLSQIFWAHFLSYCTKYFGFIDFFCSTHQIPQCQYLVGCMQDGETSRGSPSHLSHKSQGKRA